MEEEGLIHSKTRDIQVLKKAQEQPEPKYTHIIADESQDLPRVQLELLKILYKPGAYSSFLFVADTAQSIYPHSWLVRGRNFTSQGLDLTGRGNVLSKNYRTTTQIAQAAYSLIEESSDIVEDEYYVEPAFLTKRASIRCTGISSPEGRSRICCPGNTPITKYIPPRGDHCHRPVE